MGEQAPHPDPHVAAPHVAIVIPMKNEADNLAGLFAEIDAACAGAWPFEVIAVNDGSTDETADVIRAEMAKWPWLRGVAHAQSAGKSAAIRSGALASRATHMVTMDGDGQNNPADVPTMIAMLDDAGAGLSLVAAERVGRTDTGIKKMASRVANRARNALLHDNTRDTANGLKAMRRDAYLALPFFDTMHRFFPALMVRDGLKVGHLDVVDRERRFGQSKYGILDRLAVGIPDLLGMVWLRRRRRVVPRVTEITRDPV